MPKFDKPDSPNIIWGVDALDVDLTKPSDSYIQTGWTQIKPPYEYENYSMNKLYQGFAYYNQLGIPEWDSVTEYQAGKSYVQGSNNRVYRCIQTHTNRNPATSGNEDWWEPLIVTETQIGNLFNNSLQTSGHQFFPGGLLLQWDSFQIPDNQQGTVVNYPIEFPNNALFINGSISMNDIPQGTDGPLFDYEVSLLNRTSYSYSYNRTDTQGRDERLFVFALGF